MPAIWCSDPEGSAPQLARAVGLPFAFAHHFSSAQHRARADCTAEFTPCKRLERPHAMVGGERDLRDHRTNGPEVSGRPHVVRPAAVRHPGPVASPERRRPPTPTPIPTGSARKFAQGPFPRQALGLPGNGPPGQLSACSNGPADELMITTMVYDIEDRIRPSS